MNKESESESVVPGPGLADCCFRASYTCLATMSEIFLRTDADKSESSLSCMSTSAAAAGKSSAGTFPLTIALQFHSYRFQQGLSCRPVVVWTSSFLNSTSQKERVFQKSPFSLKCCFTHRNRRFIRLGTGAQQVHFDFHTAPELCALFLVECYFTE